MADTKPPVIFLELCDKRSSGFVKIGTEGTSYQEELNCANTLWLPNSGFRAKEMKGPDGKPYIGFEEVRWIKHCDTIIKQEQDARGFKPNRTEDKIPFEKGHAIVVREGATASLYDYLKDVFWNEDSPNRPVTADAVYRIQQLDKKAEELNENEIEIADAIAMVASLRTKAGEKEYKYNEQRIDLFCEICQVYADSPSQKLYALMQLAKAKPRWFLDMVVTFEQTIVTEITQALELRIIRFDGNTALYDEGDKVLKPLGFGNLGHDKKVTLLAEYLGSKEGAQDLTELRTKLDIAKKNALK
jgi:hypothetical protein